MSQSTTCDHPTINQLPADLLPLLQERVLSDAAADTLVNTGAFQIWSYWIGGQGNVPYLEPAYCHADGPRWRGSPSSGSWIWMR